MRNIWLWVVAAILVGTRATSLSLCQTSRCDRSARNLSPFGAEGNAASPLPLDAVLRSQLPGLNDVRRTLDTRLAPSGEKVVIYDAAADQNDPHPTVAIFTGNRLVRVFDDELNNHPGGFERYLSSCEFNITKGRRALAVVVSGGYDGAGSTFAIIAWQDGKYRVIFDPMAAQGRMEMAANGLKLWRAVYETPGNRSPLKIDCIWCPHRYAITGYRWRRGKFIAEGTRRTNRRYDPAKISGTPLLVR